MPPRGPREISIWIKLVALERWTRLHLEFLVCRRVLHATQATPTDPADRVHHPACRRISLAAEPAQPGRSQRLQPTHDVPDGGSPSARSMIAGEDGERNCAHG